MVKIVKKIRHFLILGLCTAISLIAASGAMADTVTIANSLAGLVYYDGEYCGKIGATFNGTTDSISGGIACVDISKHTNTGAVISVNISTLQPSNLTNARFTSISDGIFKYEEAAWLLGQIPTNSGQVGEIQFAIWRLFDPDYVFQANSDRTAATKAIEDSWLAQAGAIIPQNYDFSSVCIYTPINITGLPDDNNVSNQEFMSGAAIKLNPTGNVNPAPIPASIVLLATGLLALAGLSYERRRRSTQGDGQNDI